MDKTGRDAPRTGDKMNETPTRSPFFNENFRRRTRYQLVKLKRLGREEPKRVKYRKLTTD